MITLSLWKWSAVGMAMMNERVHVFANNCVFRVIAKQPKSSSVAEGAVAFRIHSENALRGRIQDQPKLFLAFSKGARRTLAFGDVMGNCGDATDVSACIEDRRH